jgi:hypothetical protein
LTLEELVAHLNGLAFWKEFTFSQNKFAPQPGSEFELADNLIWLADYATVFQLKERAEPTTDPATERVWFQKRVVGKATRQIRDTLRFLGEHSQIKITNERGHAFEIKGANLRHITKIVVFLGSAALPEDCRHAYYHISSTAGFIHLVAAHDYLGILEKLRVPEDIRRYFEYREQVTPKLRQAGVTVDESDIMGAFLTEQDIPTSSSREVLRRFLQDLGEFDLSMLIANLHEHIQTSERPYDYYRIMLEFARAPRSVWREIKVRIVKSLDVIRKGNFTQPFRLTYPMTDCAFMIAPLDPQLPATGREGEELRMKGLQNLTYAAMYDTKASKGVGLLISKDGEYFQLDWCSIDMPWARDPEMDRRLAEGNPFRTTTGKTVNSFRFAPER